MTLNDLLRRFPDDDAARLWLEAARWPNGPECPHCGAVGRASWLRTRRLWACTGGCRKQFSVTAGTPMHKTHLPLRMWIQAMWLMTTSSKGISSLKLGEWLGIQRRTAWHLAHRVRAMMAEDSPMLRGIVEIDETYAGAPPRKRNTGDDDPANPPDAPQGPTGRGTKRPLVLVAVERGGKAEARVIATHGKAAIAAALSGKLAADAVVMTDGLPAYKHIGATRTHLAVNHSAKEYARTDAVTGHSVHVNTVESWNGMLRRAIIGVFHSVSTKHLNRYCAETAFRWNHRTGDVLNRLAGLIRNGRGRVLPFRDLVGAAA